MSAAAQCEMFAAPSPSRAAPSGRWQRDRDGYVALPGAAPLFARKLDAADARLDAGTVVGRDLQRSAIAQLARLAELGCVIWAS